MMRKFITFLSLIAITLVGTAAPMTGHAEETSLHGAKERVSSNLDSLNGQAADLRNQIGDLDAEISDLRQRYAELERKGEELRAALMELIKQSYIIDSSSTSLDELVSSKSLSELFSGEHYRVVVNDEVQDKADEYVANQKALEDSIAAAQEKRQGLLTLKGQLENRIQAAKVAEEARLRLERMKEAEYERMKEADAQHKASELAGQTQQFTPSRGGSNPFEPGYVGQCTWYVHELLGVSQPTNAGNWTANSSRPVVGSVMIWRVSQIGGVGHVGVVRKVVDGGRAVWVQHMNWTMGPGVPMYTKEPSTGNFWIP